MRSTPVLKSIVVASVCALALVAAVGCSSATSSSASSASASAASASATSASASNAASSATASSAAASTSAAASSAVSSTASAAKMTEEEAVAQGYQVFKGTVRVCNGEELIKLQGVDIDPAAAGGGGTYAVLVFDQPTDVKGMQADGSGEDTRSSKMLGIAEYTDYTNFVIEYGDLDKCKSLDGQQVAVAAKAANIMFPSDVRFPIGEPSANTSVFLS